MNPVILGQHFLINKNIAQKMVQRFLPAKGPILEIGPGKGILTNLLISLGKENNLVAVERDKKLFQSFGDQLQKNFKIIHADILDIQLNQLFPDENINLIGNIPYYISKEIIDWIINEYPKINKGILMMQKEFVGKLIPSEDLLKNSAQMLMFKSLYNSHKEFDVNPGSFSPLPRVVSAVFTFQKNEPINKNFNTRDFYNFLKRCFLSRRKTLLNNLGYHYGKKEIKMLFLKQKLSSDLRPEQLALADFFSIFQWLEQDNVSHPNQINHKQ